MKWYISYFFDLNQNIIFEFEQNCYFFHVKVDRGILNAFQTSKRLFEEKRKIFEEKITNIVETPLNYGNYLFNYYKEQNFKSGFAYPNEFSLIYSKISKLIKKEDPLPFEEEIIEKAKLYKFHHDNFLKSKLMKSLYLSEDEINEIENIVKEINTMRIFLSPQQKQEFMNQKIENLAVKKFRENIKIVNF